MLGKARSSLPCTPFQHLRTVPYNVPFQVSNVYPFHSKTDLKLITIIINFKRENLMLEDNHYQHRELQMLKHTHKYYFLLLDSYLVKFWHRHPQLWDELTSSASSTDKNSVTDPVAPFGLNVHPWTNHSNSGCAWVNCPAHLNSPKSAEL